ncbi:MAG: hypothetical protein CME06_11625 [Gemmatimonadetes bacterium]|nr:hypothetical protein [Gemmatimonadota bacterium]
MGLAILGSVPNQPEHDAKPTAWGDLDILVTPAQRMRLRRLSYHGFTLIEDVQAEFDDRVDADGDMGAYHTYDEMLDELDRAVLDHSDILRVYELGPTWETVNMGADRSIWAVKITDQPDIEEADEPALLFIGNTHAREVITVEIPLELIHDLTDAYGDLFLYTWSYTRADTPDHSLFYALGDEATRFNGYLAGNPKSGAIYTANGEWDDFMYAERRNGKAKTFSFTAEVGCGCSPAISKRRAAAGGSSRYVPRGSRRHCHPDADSRPVTEAVCSTRTPIRSQCRDLGSADS